MAGPERIPEIKPRRVHRRPARSGFQLGAAPADLSLGESSYLVDSIKIDSTPPEKVDLSDFRKDGFSC